MKVCGLLFRRSLHAAHTTSPPALILSLFSLKSIYRDHIWYCDDDVCCWFGRFLTKIESVACQIWLSLGQLTIFPCFTCWVDQEQAIRTFYGSDQPPAARPVNGTFPSFYGRSIPDLDQNNQILSRPVYCSNCSHPPWIIPNWSL